MPFIIPPPPPIPFRLRRADPATKAAIRELADFLAVPAVDLEEELGYEMAFQGEPEPMPTERVLK